MDELVLYYNPISLISVMVRLCFSLAPLNSHLLRPFWCMASPESGEGYKRWWLAIFRPHTLCQPIWLFSYWSVAQIYNIFLPQIETTAGIINYLQPHNFPPRFINHGQLEGQTSRLDVHLRRIYKPETNVGLKMAYESVFTKVFPFGEGGWLLGWFKKDCFFDKSSKTINILPGLFRTKVKPKL